MLLERMLVQVSHLFPRTGLIRRMMESGKGSRGKEEPYDGQRKLFPSAGTPRNKLTRVRIRSVYDYSAPVVHFARGVCISKVNCIVLFTFRLLISVTMHVRLFVVLAMGFLQILVSHRMYEYYESQILMSEIGGLHAAWRGYNWRTIISAICSLL